MVARIPVGPSGATAIVDDDDFAWLSVYRWSVYEYAVRQQWSHGRPKTIYMHREIVAAPDGVQVDHINGDKLDNRRANLRLVTRNQNAQNLRGARADSRIGLRGVERTHSGRFRARVWVRGRAVHAGTFDTAEEAGRAAAAARHQLMTHSSECGVG
jgi:hypothetical protein